MSISELLLLKRSFERLDRQYRGAEEKIAEFRDKLREARIDLATKDRQLDAARKLLAKLGQEKSELALVAEQNRELSRTLNAKLSLNSDVPELQSKLHRSKRKIGDLTAQLHDVQTRLLLAEESGRQSAAEVAVLKKALGLRSELPGHLAGYDGQAQLLQALAKSQEESASLAAQLADTSRRTAAVEQQVSHLQTELERSAAIRAAGEEALAAARKETAEAHGREAAKQVDLDEANAQLRRSHAHLQELQSARRAAEETVDKLTTRNRQLKEKLTAAERASKAQAEALRAELQSLAESAEAEVQQLHELHAGREGSWEAQLTAAQKQLTELESRLSQSSRDHESELQRLQSRVGALEASLEGSRLREGSLEREGEALREEVGRLSKLNQELAANLAAARQEAEVYAERAEEAACHMDAERRLRMQSQSQLEAASTRAAVREEQMAATVGRLRAELGELNTEHERNNSELKLCHEKLSDANARQSTYERHIDELHTTIQSLTRSKTKLQNTMLDQLSQFKSKLHQVEQDNLSLRAALSAATTATSRGDEHRPTRGSVGSLADALAADTGPVTAAVSVIDGASAPRRVGGSSGSGGGPTCSGTSAPGSRYPAISLSHAPGSMGDMGSGMGGIADSLAMLQALRNSLNMVMAGESVSGQGHDGGAGGVGGVVSGGSAPSTVSGSARARRGGGDLQQYGSEGGSGGFYDGSNHLDDEDRREQ